MGLIGVKLKSCLSFHDLTQSCGDGLKDDTISIITQNVDTLHTKAGTRHCLHLRESLRFCVSLLQTALTPSCELTRIIENMKTVVGTWSIVSHVTLAWREQHITIN